MASRHQGIAILTRKGIISKIYKCDSTCVLSIKMNFKNRTVFVIGAYLKEEQKREIISQVKYIVKRIRRAFISPNIIVASNLNTNSKLNIEDIEEELDLYSTKTNKEMVT